MKRWPWGKGLGTVSCRQSGLVMPEEVSRHQVQQLIAEGAQVVDVMPAAEFRRSHLVGAVHIPLKQLAEKAVSQLDRAGAVVVYCYDSL